MKKLQHRQRIYDLYWQFAAERQAIFYRRFHGETGPWTDDPVLRQYKFCNVFRAADRVSQYMIRQVIYNNEQVSEEDKLFQIVAFRTFSKEATWDSAREYLGHYPRLDDLASGEFLRALEYAKEQHGGLYTGAFILCANNAYGYSVKHRNHVALFQHMFLQDDLASHLLNATSLQEVYNLLHGYPLMGDFMSYQTAVDLNYSPYINFDENDFVKAGPGSLRGIHKVFESIEGRSPEEIIMDMVERQDEEFARLGLSFPGLFGRKLQAIDCQGLFCELDKYCRIVAPYLTSSRKRMKAVFKPRGGR